MLQRNIKAWLKKVMNKVRDVILAKQEAIKVKVRLSS